MPATATQSVATVQSTLFGDSVGNRFNDVETVVGFPANITINVDQPLKAITVMHGGVVDGIELEYAIDDGQTSRITHGTSRNSTDSGLHKSTVQIGERENIIAVSGIHGNSPWGIRVCQLSFTIYNSENGQMRVAGPFGNGQSSSPQTFHVTANGTFVALGGFAVNTDSSLAQLDGRNGGLYGLTFFDIDYRTV